MKNLTYSTFMNLLIESYDDSISSEELARGLLDEITPDKMHDKYSSAYLSYIFTGQGTSHGAEGRHLQKRIQEKML